MADHGVEFYFAGCDLEAPVTSSEEDLSWVPPGRYRRFDLARIGVQLAPEIARFCRWLRSTRCDVIHVHHRRLACLANLASPFHGLPVLYTCHGTFPKSPWFSALCPKIATGVSPSVLDYLRQCTSARTVLLTYNPYPFPPLPSSAPPKSGAALTRAISVARLEPIKGHIHLISAWQILRSRGIQPTLDLFGEGSLYAELAEKVRAERLDQYIKFKGFCGDVGQEFRSSLFNVLVSGMEGFPNVVVEAAAEGLPTLLNDVDGARDAVPDDAILPNKLPFGDVHKLADALSIWFASPDRVAADGQKFRAFLQSRTSPAAVAQRYEYIYTCLSRQRPLTTEVPSE